MAMKRFSAASPAKLLTKYPGNNAQARIGHVNEVIDELNKNAVSETVILEYPFTYYPYASMIEDGIKFEYQPWSPGEEGMKLKSYSINGIQQIYGTSFENYLGSIVLSDINTMGAILLPGEINGSIQFYEFQNYSYLSTSPLAEGSLAGATQEGANVYIKNLQFLLVPYDQFTNGNSTKFAVLLKCDFQTADGVASELYGNATSMSYQYKFLTSSDYTTTFIQD